MKVRNDEDDGVRRVEKEVKNAVLIANLVDSTTGGALAGEAEVTCVVEISSSSVLAGEPFPHVFQSWNCSQVENAQGRYAMDWLLDDEMMKQWDEISQDEEEMDHKKRVKEVPKRKRGRRRQEREQKTR